MYIEKIKGPADVKRLGMTELEALCGEIRTALLQKLSHHGGHVGPNLGMVEAIVAMHYVFDSPRDRFVFDVSHQSYAHKMLTGRAEAFLQSDHYNDVSGYTNPAESEHDWFTIGHTSTSISLASGLAKARDLQGGHENVVAVIGDGSLSGGEAFEGLDFAAEGLKNLIIVVNDNQMSIAENHGGLYANLAALRASNGQCECNYFKALGLDYTYVAEGNDLTTLIDTFKRVKDTTHPIVVHINTLKGKGYAPAVADKERWHWSMPFDLPTGHLLHTPTGEDYTDLFAQDMLRRMAADRTLALITAGTPGVLGFTPDRRHEAGHQFVDVGIAEEHAVAMASGIARGGARAVFGVMSSFVQRTYDQLSQDLCINKNPAVLVVLGGGIEGLTDATHLGFFDIALLSNIPNMVYLAPTSKEEMAAMLDWALTQREHPVAVRMPAGPVVSRPVAAGTDFGRIGCAEVVKRGKQVALLGLGNYFSLAAAVAERLAARGIEATLVNPRYASHLDTALLDSLQADHRVVVTLEDGVIEGGWGQKVASHLGATALRVLNYGARKEFVDRYQPAAYLEQCRLTAPQIEADVLAVLG